MTSRNQGHAIKKAKCVINKHEDSTAGILHSIQAKLRQGFIKVSGK
jgi:hypothetical protein